MTLETFLFGVFIVSALTGLVTEAFKKLFDEAGRTYRSNALACCVSIVLAILVGIAYAILNNLIINSQMMVYLIALILLSWLSAMVGYDKVVQTISQFKQ